MLLKQWAVKWGQLVGAPPPEVTSAPSLASWSPGSRWHLLF